jgi:hypothetical protein
MEHNRYEKLHFLNILLARTDSEAKNFFYDELINAARTGYMHADRAKTLFTIFRKKEYIHDMDDPTPVHPGTKLYFISDAGRIYLNRLQKESEKDELDLKLKNLTIRNIRITKIIAYASLIISLATGGVQIYRLIDEKQNPKYSIRESQINQLLQSHQDLSSNLQKLQQEVLRQDTSVKRIRVVKK